MAASAIAQAGRIALAQVGLSLGVDLFKSAIDKARGMLPEGVQAFEVEVYGGPGADIRRIWYLCMSIAFGRYRNRIRTAFKETSVACSWDITNKAVSLEILSTTNSLTEFTGANVADPGSSIWSFMHRGPEQLTVGGNVNTVLSFIGDFSTARVLNDTLLQPAWEAKLVSYGCLWSRPDALVSYMPVRVLPGEAAYAPNVLREWPIGTATQQTKRFYVTGKTKITGTLITSIRYPFTVLSGTETTFAGASLVINSYPTEGANRGKSRQIPCLPDAGRVITTVEKNDVRVQPPKPLYDGVSRSSLLALTAQALQMPCWLPDSPPCTTTAAGGSGLYVAQPNDNVVSGAEGHDLPYLWAKRGDLRGSWPEYLRGNGPDGVRLPKQVPNYARL